MGFDLHLICLRKGRSGLRAREIAEAIFERDALSASKMAYVEYADGCGEIYCRHDGEEFDGFMLSHFSGDTIVERVVEIANITQSLMFWPSPYISFGVTDRSVLDRLPQELLDDHTKVSLLVRFTNFGRLSIRRKGIVTVSNWLGLDRLAFSSIQLPRFGSRCRGRDEEKSRARDLLGTTS